MLFPLVARTLRLASIAISAIAILYLASFALDQTSSASSHQQAQVNSAAGPAAGSTSGTSAKESGLHEAIDKAFEKLASPFSGVISSASGEWAVHIVDTLIVLAIYGFGLAFVARLLKLAPA
jgi:hypothetical protein